MPKRKTDSHKGDYGRVMVVGGNAQMGGAILLSASAAVYSGAGLVTTATDESNKTALFSHLPESMFLSFQDTEALSDMIPSMDAVLVGPGLGRDEEAKHILQTVLKSVTPKQHLVIDGDALTLLAQENYSLPECDVILTPHPGEWESLSGLSPDEENPEANHSYARVLGATVVLKKHRTEIYFSDEVLQNTAGNSGMATGGMGDTLAGMIVGFLPQFASTREAVTAAVYLHSKIGDFIHQQMYVTLPSQIISHIPFLMKQYTMENLPKV